MVALPTGTVTFLFTDIEGSTELLQRLGDRRYAEVLAEHQRLLRDAFAEGNGQEIDTQGDAFLVAFSRARDAVGTAVAAQRALTGHAWPDAASLRVRMGLHTGEPVGATDRYVGLDVHRAARIGAAGHGGQILLSDAVSGLAARDLPLGVSLRDLGNHRLKDLREPEHLLQVVHPDLPADFPPIKSLDVFPNNLPRQLTSFIGRNREMAEVKKLLANTCLLTLTGSGGSGKTRLALQVATDLLERYPDGVWLAQLAPLSEPALVPKAVASALDIPEQPGRLLTDTVVDYLRSRSLLLLLDNCEHLLQACADLANVLLQACPNLRILATSREALGIAGELAYRVPSLSVPDPHRLPSPETLSEYEAVRLFVERAALIKTGFSITGVNASAVAQICQRLDGIPLALELAAARVKALSVEQICARLNDRFRLLTGGSRTALPRQQTLRAVMDWSYSLLADPERTLLRRLAVFSGGFTLEAAEAVCAGDSIEAATILDLLARLVDKSLVVMDDQDGTVRYRLLETVRQYAQDRLLETEETAKVRRRHLDVFLAFAEDAEPRFKGAEEVEWLDRLEVEHDNLRASLAWSVEGADTVAALRLVGALGWFWYRRAYWAEGRDWAQKALDSTTDAVPSVRLKALAAAGRLAWAQGDLDEAANLLGQAVVRSRLLGDKREIGRSLYALGHTILNKGDLQQADTMLEESAKLSREVGDTYTAASALRFRSMVAIWQENSSQARVLAAESLVLYRHIGYKRGFAWATYFLSLAAYHEQNYTEARGLVQESLALFQDNHDEEGKAWGHILLGNVARRTGEHDRAIALLKNSLLTQQKMGAKRHIIATLESLGAASTFQGDMPRGARLFGVAATLRKMTGAVSILGPLDHNEAVATVRVALGEATFADEWAAGEAMTLDQAIEYALAPETG